MGGGNIFEIEIASELELFDTELHLVAVSSMLHEQLFNDGHHEFEALLALFILHTYESLHGLQYQSWGTCLAKPPT